MTRVQRIEPVVRSVRVPAAPEAAFGRFTAELATWWPLATHSVGDEGKGGAEMVRWESGVGGRIVERTSSGAEHVWGTVTTWEPPRRLVFTWHPGRDPSTAQEVEVRFDGVEGGTELTLVHRGWERYGEGAESVRDQYVEGWEYVLGRYARVDGR